MDGEAPDSCSAQILNPVLLSEVGAVLCRPPSRPCVS